MGDARIFMKNFHAYLRLSLINTHTMSLISPGSISVDSTFKWDYRVRNNALPASGADPDSNRPDPGRQKIMIKNRKIWNFHVLKHWRLPIINFIGKFFLQYIC